jgi:hypothetical protein
VYEPSRPLPFVNHLDYDAWSLVNFDTSQVGLAKMLDKLATMPAAEFHRRQSQMRSTIEQLTLRTCAGQPLLFHIMAALTERSLADLYGASYLTAPQVMRLKWTL